MTKEMTYCVENITGNVIPAIDQTINNLENASASLNVENAESLELTLNIKTVKSNIANDVDSCKNLKNNLYLIAVELRRTEKNIDEIIELLFGDKELTEILDGLDEIEIEPVDVDEIEPVDVIDSNIKPKNNSDIAHRGNRKDGMRDNSIEAFINAGENGFWGCETDVRFDANGNLICSHNAPKKGEKPPTFEEYLDICNEYGMTAIIDLKYANGSGYPDYVLSPTVLDTIQKKGMTDSCIIQTNNHNDVPYIRQNSSDARIWYLVDSLDSGTMNLITENDVECVNTKSSTGIWDRIDRLNEQGIDVCVWGVKSVDRKEQLKERRS